MSICDGATVVQFERSSDGQAATVLGAGDAVLATCDDAGTVRGADGSTLMTAGFWSPRGAHYDVPGADLKRLRARVTVAASDGAAAGTLGVRHFKVTPFSRTITIAMLDPDGTEVGELSAADRKGHELAVSAGGSTVASLALADRDRGLRRTVEHWTLRVHARPPVPADLLAAAAVLRYGKMLAEVSAPRDR